MPDMRHKKQLLNAIRNASTSTEFLDQFLIDLLTPKEYAVLVTRWEIVRRLANGEPQRAIAKDIGVGIGTVTRGAREMQNVHGGFHRMLERV